MEFVLYSDPLSEPENETITEIQNLDSDSCKFILLLGSSASLKTEFFQSLKKNIEDSKTHFAKNTTTILIEKTEDNQNTIWCNSQISIKNKSENHKIYIQNLVKYSSKIIFFIEYKNANSLKECIELLKKFLISDDSKIFHLLICINIVVNNSSLDSIKSKVESLFSQDFSFGIDIEYHYAEYEEIDETIPDPYINKFNEIKELAFCKFSYVKCISFFSDLILLSENESEPISIQEDFTKQIDIKDEFECKLNDKTNENIDETFHSENDIKDIIYNNEVKRIYTRYDDENCETKELLETWYNLKKNEVETEIQTYKKKLKNLDKICIKLNINIQTIDEINYSDYSLLDESSKTILFKRSWLKSKLNDQEIELKNIMIFYNEKIKKFDNENKIREILNSKIYYICEKRDGSNVENTIRSVRNLIYKYEIALILSEEEIGKLIEKFIYQNVDNEINKNEIKLKKNLQLIHDKFNEILIEFRNNYYAYDIDDNFTILEAKAIKFYKNNNSYLGKKSLDIIKNRLQEFKLTVEYSKKMTPDLNLKITICPNCGKKGTLRILNNNYQTITIFDVKKTSKVLKYTIKCSSSKRSIWTSGKICEFDEEVEKFISKGFEFRVNEKGEYISINKK